MIKTAVTAAAACPLEVEVCKIMELDHHLQVVDELLPPLCPCCRAPKLFEVHFQVVDSGLLCLIKSLQLVDVTGLQLSG